MGNLNKWAVAISAIVLIFLIYLLNSHVLDAGAPIVEKIRREYKDVSVKRTSFQGNDVTQVSGNREDVILFLSVGANYDKAVISDFLNNSQSEIDALTNPLKIFDPYLGTTTEINIPTGLKPIKEEISVNGVILEYYIVYVNEIFSYFVFSEEQAKFKGIASVFECRNDVYKIQLLSDIKTFDKEKMVSELKTLYCV